MNNYIKFYFCLLPLFLGVPALAQTPVSSTNFEARMLLVEGSVQVFSVGATNWAKAYTDQSLHIGDRLRTGPHSRAAVRYSDLTILRVKELSTIQIRPPQQPGKQTLLDIQAGSVYFLGREKPAQQEFHTPLTSGAIRGTEFDISVAEDGRTVVALIDGALTLSNPLGQLDMSSGELGTVDPGAAPKKTALIDAVNIIQWCLYYPGVLDTEELDLNADERRDLAASLAAYKNGDLLQALAAYPANRSNVSGAERVYAAAISLSAGQVERAEALLASTTAGANSDRSGKLALSLREMIAVVKNQPAPRASSPSLATEWLAESYYFQSQSKLPEALQAAWAAVAKSPDFGFGWARVAELELSFGRTLAAKSALEKSLQRAPRNAESLAVKGFLLAVENRISEAQAAFDQAIALDGALGNAWLGRGLCKIREGHAMAGREDIQVAVILESQRSTLRSYLGKAFSNSGDDKRAQKELTLAGNIDANDPTSWFYRALVEQKDNEVNRAVRDLEKSERLNDNQRLFRSRLLLDEDAAVRGANLANIYQDAGMFDWSVREASRAVNNDYANYSAHQFLANSYDALRDPNQINLRYETPWFSELIVSELLAPVGSVNLSEYNSQQQYARLFEQNHFGASSDTEYTSHGDWFERASQFGTYDTVTYAIDAEYRRLRGTRPNDDLKEVTVSTKAKDQLTSQDSIFIEGIYGDSSFGDTAQYYNQYSTLPGVTAPSPTFHGSDRQQPNLFIGYHHEWAPGSHTLLLLGHLDDELRYSDPNAKVPFTANTFGSLTFDTTDSFPVDYDRRLSAYTVELQQIWETERQTFVAGARYQLGSSTTDSKVVDNTFNNPPLTLSQQELTTELQRVSFYAYETVKLFDQLQLTGGVVYDRLRFPRDIDTSPITGEEAETDQVSPKAGIIWSPLPDTHLRAAYTRSLGGLFYDASVRLEPTQVAGFNQAFRSLIPESIEGLVPGTRFTTYSVGVDQALKSNTYLSVDGEILDSDAQRSVGVVTNTGIIFPVPQGGSTIRQALNFEEKSLVFSASQLLNDQWSAGVRYQLSRAKLTSTFIGILAPQDQAATLQQLSLYANYYHPCGFFSQGQALWTAQNSQGYNPGLPGDNFWQLNLYAGYRFLHRSAEVKAGLLNITGQDYALNPLNLYYDLPRQRTLALSFKFYF